MPRAFSFQRASRHSFWRKKGAAAAPPHDDGGPHFHSRARGFTLIELLVAIAVMALLAVLSWRGLDGMSRAQEQTRTRGDQVLALQAGLAQWNADLDAVTQRPHTTALDWDGRALRITRRGSGDAAEGLRVTAWSRRTLPDGNGWWLRWESPPLVTLAQWRQSWDDAAQWAQNPGEALRRREVPIARADGWQVFYFRNNAWTNPLSSGDAAPGAATIAGVAQTVATGGLPPLPDGVRLSLVLSPGQALSGLTVRDWVSPAVAGEQ